MSGFYAAGQFDHSFKPTKLLNWTYGTNPWPGKFAICSPNRCCPTEFIACDNGHLFPCVPRNCCTSPWGDYSLHIWEQTKPCCCIRKLRHPELFKPPRLIYIANEVPKPGKVACETAKEFNCPETKKCMNEDAICGRDPCCPGQKCVGPYMRFIGRTMIGDSLAMKKKMVQERRAEMKRSMAGRRRGKGGSVPAALTFRFTCGCSAEAAKRGCKKPSWRF